MTTLRKHIFKSNNAFYNLFAAEEILDITAWLEENQIPHERETDLMASQFVMPEMKTKIYSYHVMSDPGHPHHIPLLTYTLIDDESAILFKLKFGDYFDHEVKEQE